MLIGGMLMAGMFIGGFGLDVHGLAIATDAHGNCPAGRNFANQAPQLFHAFDLLLVDGQDDIMFFQSGFACGSILVHHGDFDAALFSEVKRVGTVCSDVARVNAEIRTTPRLLAVEHKWL